MDAPTVSPALDANDARRNLQSTLILLAKIATTVGAVPMAKAFASPELRDIARHFEGIEKKLADFAVDDIPF